MKRMELLSPAGDMERMKAAFAGGADAVYLAGKAFGARTRAGNFTREELIEAVEYAHLRNKKIYVTVNTLYFENETEIVFEYLYFLNSINVDAVIIQDLMLIETIRDLYPDLKMHASTQMGLHSSAGARWAKEQGFDRIVLAREVSIADVEKISQMMEVEVFIHGAHCISYSGQCLMSSLIGGRSGNRGACAQPCRKRYQLINQEGEKVDTIQGEHLLSPKDLRVADQFVHIMKSHITSLKIEGRMKSPQYAFSSAHYYRSLLDHKAPIFDPAAIFNRLETAGRLFGRQDQQFMNFDSPENHGAYIGEVVSYENRLIVIDSTRELKPGDEIKVFRDKGSIGARIEKKVMENTYRLNSKYHFVKGERLHLTYDTDLISRIDDVLNHETRTVAMDMFFSASVKNGMTLRLSADGLSAEVTNPTAVEASQKISLTGEEAGKQLGKLGDTVYKLDSFSSDLEEGLYIKRSDLNGIRRDAVDKLDSLRLKRYQNREVVEEQSEKRLNRRDIDKQQLTVEINTLEQLRAVDPELVDGIYYADFDTLLEAKKIVPDLIPVLPEILKDAEYPVIDEVLEQLDDVKVLLVRTIGQLERYSPKYKIETDVTFNITNSYSHRHLESQGVKCVTLSEELSGLQIEEMLRWNNSEVAMTIYGYQRSMITEYCIFRTIDQCKLCSLPGSFLEDEKGFKFPLMRAYGCRMKVMNSHRLHLIDKMETLTELPIDQYRLRMTLESSEEVDSIIRAYRQALSGEAAEIKFDTETTTGHFIRGVKE